MGVKLIVAMCKNNGIGSNNKIPWHISEDMNYFSKKTSGAYGTFIRKKNIKQNHIEDLDKCENIKKNVVVMGRNTWESLPKKYKPLPYRYNIILSRSSSTHELHNNLHNDVVFSSSIDDVMDLCYMGNDCVCMSEKGEKGEKRDKSLLCSYNDIWIIGGSSVYREFISCDNSMMSNIKISKYYITYIDKHYDCDTYFPLLENMNKYYITRFEKHRCIDNNTPNEMPLNIYYIVFKKIEYTDEILIKELFTAYKSKNETKSNLTLYVKDKIKKSDKNINGHSLDNDFEILFSLFCS